MNCKPRKGVFIFLAGVTGLEPATSSVTGKRSNQLSYTPKFLLKNLTIFLVKLKVFVLIQQNFTCQMILFEMLRINELENLEDFEQFFCEHHIMFSLRRN